VDKKGCAEQKIKFQVSAGGSINEVDTLPIAVENLFRVCWNIANVQIMNSIRTKCKHYRRNIEKSWHFNFSVKKKWLYDVWCGSKFAPKMFWFGLCFFSSWKDNLFQPNGNALC